VRWIDPDAWGFRGWSLLFAIARNITSSSLPLWWELVKLLPYLLPCFTCRCCCSKFIKRNPPEKSLATPPNWLNSLRREITLRNFKSPDCNRLDRAMNLNENNENNGIILDRFAQRLIVPSLWLMDVFIFLACVAMTQDLTQEVARKRWISFITLVTKLSPIDLHLTPPPPFAHRSVEEVIQWITASPKCLPQALLATIATVAVKLRTITK